VDVIRTQEGAQHLGLDGDQPDRGNASGHTRGIRDNGVWVLITVGLAVAMVGLDGTIVAVANPYIAKGLHGNLSDLQWVANAYLLALAVLLVPMGKVGDRYGRRLLMLIGTAGFALSSLGVGLIGSIGGVIAFRAVLGVFGAMLMPNTLAIVRSAFPKERLNFAVAVWGAAAAVSVAAGPVVAGLLVQHASWPWCFYINLPIGAVTVLLGLFTLAESRDTHHRHHVDIPGLLLVAGGLFCVVFGLVKADTWGWGDAKTIGFLCGGIVLLVAFGLAELKAVAPLVPMHLFSSRRITFGCVATVLVFFSLFGVLFFISLYLQNVHGYDPVATGLRVLPISGAFVFSCPLGGYLNERFGPRVAVPFGMFFISLGLAGLLWLEPVSPYVHVWVPFVVLGFGIGPVVVSASSAIVSSAPVDDAAIAGSLQSTSLQIGGVLGTSVLGSVLTTRLGHVLFAKLTTSGVPATVATELQQARQLIAQGVAPTLAGAPAPLQHAIVAGSQASFMSGLHVAILVAAIVSFVAVPVGFLMDDRPDWVEDPAEAGGAKTAPPPR
jgi:EmrB/QacA subfamily drug resistance transporter